MLSVDVEIRLGEFPIAARFETAAGATALFGPSGAGKTSLVNMIGGTAAASGWCSRKAGCSRT